MIRKNLFNYLPNFDKEDQKQIKKYLQSPFFKIDSRERVIKLFDYLIKFHPEYDDPKLTNEAIAKKLKVPNVKNLKSVLLNCCEEFLIISRLNKRNTIKKKLITEALRENGIAIEHKKHLEFEINKLKKQLVKDAEDYDLLYHLLFEGFVIQSAEMINSKHSLLEDAIHAANSHYLHTNIKNLIARQALTRAVKRKSDVSLTKELIITAGKYIEKFDTNITISYYIYSFYEKEDLKEKEEIYRLIDNYSQEKFDLLTDEYRYEVYISLLNIANRLFISGLIHFKTAIFELHKFWISKNVHLSYANIHCSLFFIIVRNANDVAEFLWSESFIEQNKKYLKDNEAKETTNLCLADLAFKTGKQDQALSILNETKFLNSQFSSDGKSIELMCLFELNDSYRLDTYIKNFENFIRRHTEISDYSKLRYINFCKYIKKIEKARFDKNSSKLSQLKTIIEKDEALYYRTWLLSKIKFT